MISRLLISLLGLWVSGFAGTQMQAQPNDRIFFSSFRPEGFDIYLSKDNGKSFAPVTHHPALDYDAVITPDGKYILFTSERSGHPQLYIKTLDGTDEPRLLIRSNSMQDQVTVSPDGRTIAFVSTHESNADIYRLPFHPDSTLDIHAAVNLTGDPGGDFRPSFSPDGRTIAFCSDRANPIRPNPDFSFARNRIGNIFTMDTTGQQVKQLTTGKEWDGSPVWSSDGKQIFYYALENRLPDIWSMHADGSGQKRITPPTSRAMSPCLLPNSKIAFTSWSSGEENSFRLLTYDTTSGQTDTLVHMDIDMLHLFAHPGGTMVFHGGIAPVEQESNKGAFHGNLLIANQPSTDTIDGLAVETYGVRRAFVAPAFPDSPYLVIDSMDIRGITDVFSPWLYAFLAFPIFMIGVFFTALLHSFQYRKAVAFWRFLLASFASLFILLIVAGICFFLLMEARTPLITIRAVMMGLAVALMIAAVMYYRKTNKRKAEGIQTYRVSRLTMWTFSAGALSSVYLACCLHLLLNTETHFYKVNYLTNEVTSLFIFKPDPNLNPSFSQFIDGRISHDGKQMLLTIGGFGASAHHQGDIWSYQMESKKMVRLADSKANDGFGDLNADGQRLVFRSGRDGNFDLYAQDENGITQVTQDTHKENFPAISPQGDKIVYASDREGVASEGGPRTFDLYLHERRADGTWSEARKLTDSRGQNAHPSFSPDGEWVIYTTEDFGIMDEQPVVQNYFFSPQMYGEIVALRLLDMKKFRFTHNKWEEGAPQWVKGLK
jgi:Tol biopolymer transport system component